MKLQDRVAIVTGGAGGIGSAICLQLAREGSHVIIADMDAIRASKVCEEIRSLGRKALAVKTDVTRSESTDNMAKAAVDEFGKIDILVNVAGGVIRKGVPHSTAFHELPKDICDTTINVNLGGVLNSCRSVIPQMIRQHGGKIVNIASVAGIIGVAGTVDYSTAKGAIITFTRAASKELAQYNINVNCVSPGAIEHPRTPKGGPWWDRHKATVFAPRYGTPEDIARAVVFVASDDASYMVGQNVTVCGGRSLGDVTETDW